VQARYDFPPDDPIAQQVWSSLADARRALAAQLLSPDRDPARQAAALGDLTRQKEDLERQLAATSAAFREQRAPIRLEPADLLARLPTDTAVVELVRVTTRSQRIAGVGQDRITSEYQAFILRRAEDAASAIRWLMLGPAEPVDAAVLQWRRSRGGRGLSPLTESGDADDPSPGLTLRNLIWEPLESELDDCRRIIIIPDGSLTRVPWGALPAYDGHSMLVDQFSISLATDGSHALQILSESGDHNDVLLAVGGVDYEAESDSAPPAPDDVAPTLASRSRSPIVSDATRDGWSYLPGTLAEVEAVVRLWANPNNSRQLAGAAADELSVCDLMPRCRSIHLATHGYFSPLTSAEQAPPDLSGQGPETVLRRNPLLLSGLVLSGANRDRSAMDAANIGPDGILTAEEVAALDLRRTELVVLSACETGLGDVADGEGVFGLQRAFHQAGADSVIASLWRVDDRATQVLMSEFYSNLWELKLGKLESLRAAQETMRRRYDPVAGRLRPADSDSNMESCPPYYWAAFILSGRID
jgi:CHAT domain-containing protein